MIIESTPKALLERNPDLPTIATAIEEFKAGKPIITALMLRGISVISKQIGCTLFEYSRQDRNGARVGDLEI